MLRGGPRRGLRPKPPRRAAPAAARPAHALPWQRPTSVIWREDRPVRHSVAAAFKSWSAGRCGRSVRQARARSCVGRTVGSTYAVCGWPITTTDRPGARSIELPIAFGALAVAVVRGCGKRAVRARRCGAEDGQARPRRKLSCNFNGGLGIMVPQRGRWW